MNYIDDGFKLLAKAMDVSSARHRVIAGNIANVNTPNYRAKELRFESLVGRSIKRGGFSAGLEVAPEQNERANAVEKSDGNTVHLENEFGEMQQNRLLFDTYNAILRHKLQSVRRAINGQS